MNFKTAKCFGEKTYFFLDKRRHHDKGNATTLKFVDIFEPKLQFMFSLHMLSTLKKIKQFLNPFVSKHPLENAIFV